MHIKKSSLSPYQKTETNRKEWVFLKLRLGLYVLNSKGLEQKQNALAKLPISLYSQILRYSTSLRN